ncbi:MAG TPA: Mpo1-like protein [Vicinamibacteria bacterium]|nr:Mpo1-like protein [Vicinamibacteria bacterium]
MSPVLKAHFADYGAFHGTPGNKACHYVGIPLIMVGLFAMLSAVPLFTLGGFTFTLAEVLLLGATAYYLTLDAVLAALMFAVSVGLLVAGRRMPMGLAVALFVVGWVFQFVGHYVYEKRSPAFYRNLAHLLVGPLWILAKATGRA